MGAEGGIRGAGRSGDLVDLPIINDSIKRLASSSVFAPECDMLVGTPIILPVF